MDDIKNRMTRPLSIFLLIGMLVGSTLLAQGTPQLAITIQDEKINLTSAERAGEADVTFTSGDTIRYVITAANTGDGAMRNPSIVDPIPAHVDYIPQSAAGANAQIQFSIDGGSTYHSWPVMYAFTNDAGKTVRREASPDMITHIRWKLDATIPPGDSREMSFLVVVE